jgi:hypothetical protein
MGWTKIRSNSHLFWRIFKSKYIWIKNLNQNSFLFLFPFFCFVLVRRYFVFYLFDPTQTRSHNFFAGRVNCSAQPHIGPINLIFFGQLRPLAASRRAALFCVIHLRHHATASPPPSSHSKTVAPHRLPFPVSISRNRRHWSFIAVASLPLTARLLPLYDPIKSATRVPPLSTAPTPAPISPLRIQNHLSIRASPGFSAKRRRVAILAAPSPSGAVGENADDLLLSHF